MISLVVVGCTEREAPTEIETHVDGWKNESAHGTRVATFGPENCTTCHGSSLVGDDLVPGCYDCHNGPGGHSSRNMDENSFRFHARVVEEDGNSECIVCHGEDFRGGWSGVSCYSCHGGGPSGHPAPEEWLDHHYDAFHGFLFYRGGGDYCARCHGVNLDGGTSGVACTDCHSAP